MKLSEFDYNLPKELIAQHPVFPRTNSKLMVLQDNTVQHKHFYDLINYLKEGDVLVLNETKVLKIKIKGNKKYGGKVELMLLDNEGNAIIKGKAKIGDNLSFDYGVTGVITKKEGNKIKVEFDFPIHEVIHRIGKLPTPPYIKEELRSDSEYQTVYALKEGSFAAPTAGLHFDNDLLEKIKNKGVKIAKVCLHVSFDTFLPVHEKEIEKHEMHGELCEIDEENAKLINNAKRLFIVGTTTLRTLESLSSNGKISAGKKLTKLFIYPGYKWKLKYAGLITNFHLPKSTLLMMISAFYDREKILSAYELAVKEKYRFFSLGDAMLIFRTIYV
jgi:S-adenosylmethionine:tRNA ribosyltransferase-isomerase